MKLSIIICTFNPKVEYLEQCLNSIVQAKEKINSKLEIILVDNNSTNHFNTKDRIKYFIDLLCIKTILETKQGLTHARLRGIKESIGDYIVFIDDDNVIDSDFLEVGLELTLERPYIGAFSGNVKLKLELEPSLQLRKYLGLLVQREYEKDEWSNNYFNNLSMPCGAGLWIKRDVANYYLEINSTERSKLISDRIGDALTSGGDNDIAMCAIDLGYGMGVFKSLQVIHLIPKSRLEESYLTKLNEGIEYSAIILRYVRTGELLQYNFKTNIANMLRVLLSKGVERRFLRSTLKGRKKATKLLMSK